MVYRKGAEGQRAVVEWMPRTGKNTPLLPTPGRYAWMRLSPDGRRLALTTHESGVASIAVYDLETAETTRVTSHPGEYTGLTWVGGDYLVFGGAGGLGLVQWQKPRDPAPLLRGGLAQTPWSISPDGQRLAYYQRGSETGFDLWTVPLRRTADSVSAGEPEQYLSTRSFEVYPSFSPDGKWIAYASNDSGSWEIYVRRFPDDGRKIRVSTSGGVVPRWSPNGRELFYRTTAQLVMVLPFQIVGGSFRPGTPRPWSQHTLADTGVFPNFDVSPDGDAILAMLPAKNPQTRNHVTLMLNVGEEIRRREDSR